MVLVRPRLTDYHRVHIPQEHLDFAIPIFGEDIPLYVDPFLMWRSPSHQDKALHTALITSFNRLNWLVKKGRTEEAIQALILASECDEVGLGVSATGKGKRIGAKTANEVLALFTQIPEYSQFGFTHFEEIQLFVDGISKDRVSDIACSFSKSFLIDFTIAACSELGIPTQTCKLGSVYDYGTHTFQRDVEADLPVNPETGEPIILVPKRWLRHTPWINLEDYVRLACPRDDVVNQQGDAERVSVLRYNRDNYGVVSTYIAAKERASADAGNDPLFKQIPIMSAKRKIADIMKLPSGKTDNADQKYESSVTQLFASVLYPHLDFAAVQSRVDSGVSIRDLVFYNSQSNEFTKDVLDTYGSRQIVFELKNVKAIEREHITQLNRYLANDFGGFGVLVTRNPLPRAMFKNTIDLWSGQRRAIIALSDADISLMGTLYEGKQRDPIDVLKRKYVEFRRACPV